MATINEVYELTKYRANKAGYNSYISPDDFNLLFPRAEVRYYNQLYAAYYKTQRISDSLSKFMSDPVALTMPTSGGSAGQYTLVQTDIAHIDAITHTIDGVQYEVVRVEKDRLANHLSSVIESPTAQFPIYTEFKTYLQFYPVSVATATMIYLKYPSVSVWGYTLNGITAVNTLTGGSLYTNGTYTGVPLTGGTGTGAQATIVISSNQVTNVTITSPGNGYVVGNSLSALAATIGGTGSGFSILVSSISGNRPVYNPTTSTQPLWSSSDIDNIIYLLLQDIAENMKDQGLQQFSMTEAKTQI